MGGEIHADETQPELRLLAHCRRSPVTGFRSAYRRLTDVRGSMSVNRCIPDATPSGAERRSLTQLRHSSAITRRTDFDPEQPFIGDASAGRCYVMPREEARDVGNRIRGRMLVWRRAVSSHGTSPKVHDLPLCGLPKALRCSLLKLRPLFRQSVHLAGHGAEEIPVLALCRARVLPGMR